MERPSVAEFVGEPPPTVPAGFGAVETALRTMKDVLKGLPPAYRRVHADGSGATATEANAPEVGHDPAKSPLENAYDVYLLAYATTNSEKLSPDIAYIGPGTLNLFAQVMGVDDKRCEGEGDQAYVVFCERLRSFIGVEHPAVAALPPAPPVEVK